MKHLLCSAVAIALAAVTMLPVAAQERDRGGRSDRSGFGGRGGGDRGGPGGFGGRGGGDRGGFGGRGDRGGGSGRIQIDANQDGRLDQQEIDQMPERMREMLKSRGMKISAGTSVEDFRTKVREQFTQGDAGRAAGDGRPGQSAANRTDYASVAPFRPREKERMTVNLPPKYNKLDTNFSDQINLYK